MTLATLEKGKNDFIYKMTEDIKFKFQNCTHHSQQKTLPIQAAYLENTHSPKT
jgi:hypothetical protein